MAPTSTGTCRSKRAPSPAPAASASPDRPRVMDEARHGLARVLGAGGFGITYLATEVAIERPVAIKEYLPNGIAARARNDVSVQPLTSADNENYQWGLERFRREAQTLVAFHHPNIVSVFRYFEAN